jgi:hypothetical protein
MNGVRVASRRSCAFKFERFKSRAYLKISKLPEEHADGRELDEGLEPLQPRPLQR